MVKKRYLRSFGCQMNEHDSTRMVDLLDEALGIERTEDPTKADLLLLNTCSVREKPQEKVFSELGRWQPLKEARPGTLIAVVGRTPYNRVVNFPGPAHSVGCFLTVTVAEALPNSLRGRLDREAETALAR